MLQVWYISWTFAWMEANQKMESAQGSYISLSLQIKVQATHKLLEWSSRAVCYPESSPIYSTASQTHNLKSVAVFTDSKVTLDSFENKNHSNLIEQVRCHLKLLSEEYWTISFFLDQSPHRITRNEKASRSSCKIGSKMYQHSAKYLNVHSSPL